jgi:uncharacterized protein
MTTEDQREVIAFLEAPSTHGGCAVERIDTHASIVFLAGSRAFKLKRAVRYDYLDFSTAERRKSMCEAEVRVNRRTAPYLYVGVTRIVRRSDGGLSLGGPGVPVDWVVGMDRFDQDLLFDRLASRGALDVRLMSPLASGIGQFHLAAERRRDHGGRNGMAWVVDGNAAGFAEEGAGILDAALAASLTSHAHALLAHQGAELDRRREAGFVRQCHGDLHLRNIVLIDGRPTLFDAIEFNDEIACIDVLYDLAFLLMDLWRRQLPQHANLVLNDYLSVTRDFEGLRLLPLLLSLRSAVRAKTSATAARLQTDSPRRAGLEETARGYLTLATTLLQAPPACLIAIGGFSGSGKSTLARALAPSLGAVPGAVVLRSDEIRKQLCGVDLLTRVGPSGYRAEVTRRVYETLAERAAQTVRAGQSAIVDAVFARRGDRDAIEHVAAAAGVPFVGIWLDAPQATLVARTCRRKQDASDADAAVVHFQLAQGAGDIAWHRIPAAAAPAVVRERAARLLDARLTIPGLVGVGST